jgi:tryptophan synthase beta chain
MAASTTSTTTSATIQRTCALPKPYLPSKLPFSFRKFTSSCPSTAKYSSFAVSCTLGTRDPAVQMEHRPNEENGSVSGTTLLPRPDSFGRFGKFGGKYVPETLMYALTELESAFYSLAGDEEFQVLLILVFFCSFGFRLN